MKKILVVLSLTVMPVAAQTQGLPKDGARSSRAAAARIDNCAPIGRTANGELVYSMKCENLPAPIAPPQAKIEEPAAAPPAQPETQRTGIFGLSFDRRQSDQ